jgi:hypothetical protein
MRPPRPAEFFRARSQARTGLFVRLGLCAGPQMAQSGGDGRTDGGNQKKAVNSRDLKIHDARTGRGSAEAGPRVEADTTIGTHSASPGEIVDHPMIAGEAAGALDPVGGRRNSCAAGIVPMHRRLRRPSDHAASVWTFFGVVERMWFRTASTPRTNAQHSSKLHRYSSYLLPNRLTQTLPWPEFRPRPLPRQTIRPTFRRCLRRLHRSAPDVVHRMF